MDTESRKPNTLKELRGMAGDPRKQASAAIALLNPRQRQDVLLVALQILAESPDVEGREALLSLYSHLAERAIKRDSGAYIRSAIVRALAPIAHMRDETLFLEAVMTYEFLPPSFVEEASQLRAAGLVGLYELNSETARFHAARLLEDAHLAQMSGEPAITAVNVLAGLNELAILYQYVQRPDTITHEEIVSESLRNLVAIPESMVPQLIDSVKERDSSMAQIGLFDLLINHESGPLALDYIAAYLAVPTDLDVYRYLLLTAMMARKDELARLIVAVADDETDETRTAILIEVLSPYAADQAVGDLLSKLSTRP